MKETVYLTSGYRIQRSYSEDGLHNLYIFGIRGGYVGLFKYREEDVEKIISTLRDAPPERQQT